MVSAILRGNPFFASCCLSSLLILVSRALLKHQKPPLAAATFLPIWSLASTFLLGIAALLLPVTLDSYLYTADGSFGFQASFAGAALLLGNKGLWRAAETCYFQLPLGMTALYLLLRSSRSQEEANAFLRFAVFVGIGCFGLDSIFPAVGPATAFPRDFPYGTPQVIATPTVITAMVARNCMPSGHTAWALALAWSSAPLRSRVLRCLIWVFAGFNLLYALSAGAHYMVDLIVAVPFALAARAAARSEWRSPGFIAGAALLIGWMALLRFSVGVLQLTPAVPYALTGGTLALCYFCSRFKDLRPTPAPDVERVTTVA